MPASQTISTNFNFHTSFFTSPKMMARGSWEDGWAVLARPMMWHTMSKSMVLTSSYLDLVQAVKALPMVPQTVCSTVILSSSYLGFG